MLIPLFVCIGFMLAVLYIDLMFDVSAAPYRRTGATIPKEVLDPITYYYGRITKNPYVLMFVMLTTTLCIVAEIVYGLVPRWVGYSSLVLMGMSVVAGALKVIPTARRLGANKDPDDVRTRLARSLLPFHVVLLFNILLLVVIQLCAAGDSRLF
jgi:hypothetical protein